MLLCRYHCLDVKLKIQGTTFTTNLYVLPIQGSDIVLDIQWLQALGRVTHDYEHMTMEFSYEGRRVTLRGNTSLEPQPITFNQLQSLVHTGEIVALYELYQSPIEESNLDKEGTFDEPELLKQLLGEFSALFEPPTKLPPCQKSNHRIHLLPGTKQVSVRPYRYLYFQKTEIEKLVREIEQ